MLGPGAIKATLEILGDRGHQFYRAQHGVIYRAALTLYARDEPVDAITLADHLDTLPSNNGTASMLESVGGRQRIHELASLVPSPTTARHYARIVQNQALLRGYIRVGGEISQLGWQGGDPLETHDKAQALFKTIEQPHALGDLALPLRDFLAEDLEQAPALLGTPEDTILPTGGLAILAGLPAVGKTTVILDAAFHLASGIPWLGFTVPKPLNILLIENEGPQHKFQTKLQAKAAAWEHTLQGEISVQTFRWGGFNFADTTDAHLLRQYLDENDVDLVIGDPLNTLGMKGVGAPDEIRAFVQLLVPLGLTQNRAFWFLHHPRKELTANEINELSGAWGGPLDTLLVLKHTDSRDELRLSFPKVRWGDDGRDPFILGKLRDVASFELLRHETHEPDPSDDQVETVLRQIVAVLRKKGGALERQLIALHCETEVSNRTFLSALSRGHNRDLLAKEREGRKTLYSLSPDAYL